MKGNPRTLDFGRIQILLASPDTIRSWSFGEVTKPETINYRTFKPERDGLFCERIFGPTKDWECACGKYKGIRFKNVECDRCGVEITKSRVRRERMGHIELAVPVTHIWYVRSLPSRLRLLMDMTKPQLESIIYYEKFVVIDPGDPEKTGLQQKQLLDMNDYDELKMRGLEFEAGIGAPAIEKLLKNLDLDDLASSLRAAIKIENSKNKKKKFLKRLEVVEALRQSPNNPEWMVLHVVPVIPPDLRPLVPLEGGRFATSDLNDLYRRLINRNNRLKKLMDIRAPEVILRNEKRMLQEAVDALLDNNKLPSPVVGRNQRPLKSLSDLLKGKRGRFRQNLLGKRVDYSGRSVVVVGPNLKLHQCGLPKGMALELFKPLIIRKIEEKGFTQSVKKAKKLVEDNRAEIWDLLEEIIEDHPIMLNRAPTLHRLGIQAFYPRLVEGKAIQLHPLACNAFNADFDGDMMAVHVPLSYEAQMEAHMLMLSPHNVLSPSNGEPLATASQDMVLGLYYMTKVLSGDVGEGEVFSSPDEVRIAFDHGRVGLNAQIKCRIDGKMWETIVGRIIFWEIMPEGMEFENLLLKKGTIRKLVKKVYHKMGKEETVFFLDRLKDIGYKYATRGAISLGVDDLVVPKAKTKIIEKSRKQVERVEKSRKKGVITEGERYNAVIDIWTNAQLQITEELHQTLMKDQHGFNALGMMVDSGARGSQDQVRQLAGIRGLMAKPQKELTGQETIETPILSNFREGLTVLEYFISTHGQRKGLADTALKTADAGYLTRRLVDVAQAVTVTEHDCGTIQGVVRRALKEGEKVHIHLRDRIIGRVSNEDIFDPITDDIIVEHGKLITEEDADIIEEKGIEEVNIRSVLTCESEKGVCSKCYGLDLTTEKYVKLGEAIGIIAGESIGEPGTQLTLRTFHIGGIASRVSEQSEVRTKFGGKVKFSRVRKIEHPEDKTKHVVLGRSGEILIESDEGLTHKYELPYGSILHIEDEQVVKPNDILYEFEPYINPILSDIDGKVEFIDIIPDVTITEKVDEDMMKQAVIIDSKDRSLRPQINITSNSGKTKNYLIPTGAQILIHDGEFVKAGQSLAKLARSQSKSMDITGGLPRVSELFEARKPRDPAVISDIDGVVKNIKKSRKTGGVKIQVEGHQGESERYSIPRGRHILVQKGTEVIAGQQLCDGPIIPHDILRVKGEQDVQEYLLDEVQSVYKLQGVPISDKHIEVIIRQMLTKVNILKSGDSSFLENEVVDKRAVIKENRRVGAEGGEPARYEPLLLGITKASLSTESFFAAASFQETTRVLTQAAIEGKIDNLDGLKENVIIGSIIPAGTGFKKYRKLKITASEGEDIMDDEDQFDLEDNKFFFKGQEETFPLLNLSNKYRDKKERKY
ncbi:MAG: DNA-directed RNA polymerase subunit beta' [Candidatus Zixiibacteriota bacterium]